MKHYLLPTVFCFCSFGFAFTQNVGIGTTTPGAPLHIYNSNTDELVRMQGLNPYLGFRTLGGVLKSYAQGYGDDLLVGTAFGNSSGRIMFYNNNIPSMTILPSGNVGIGTITPSGPLSFPNLLGNKISFWHAGPNNDFGIGIATGAMRLYTAGMDRISFGWGNTTNFNETMTLFTGNGFLGMGTTNPLAKLHINQNGEVLRFSGNNPYLTFFDATNNYKGYMWNNAGNIEIGTDVTNANGEVNLKTKGVHGLTMQSDGRVRVGTVPSNATMADPTSNGKSIFTVAGSITLKKYWGDQIGEWALKYSDAIGGSYGEQNDLFFYFNGGTKASISDVDGDYATWSDYRLKENFENYRPVLNGIRKLDILTYHYKSDQTGRRSFGLVAQNVKEYFPELVLGNEEDNDHYLSITYAKTGVLALKAVQEQQAIIEALQQKIEALEKRLAVLERKPK